MTIKDVQKPYKEKYKVLLRILEIAVREILLDEKIQYHNSAALPECVYVYISKIF